MALSTRLGLTLHWQTRSESKATDVWFVCNCPNCRWRGHWSEGDWWSGGERSTRTNLQLADDPRCSWGISEATQLHQWPAVVESRGFGAITFPFVVQKAVANHRFLLWQADVWTSGFATSRSQENGFFKQFLQAKDSKSASRRFGASWPKRSTTRAGEELLWFAGPWDWCSSWRHVSASVGLAVFTWRIMSLQDSCFLAHFGGFAYLYLVFFLGDSSNLFVIARGFPFFVKW